jgi:hypothetical protein
MKSRKRVVVLGYMGACPLAGVIWQHIHYIVGLQRLGHDVYYIEDTSRFPYNPVTRMVEQDFRHAAATLASLSERYGFRDNWSFRPRYLANPAPAGLSSAKIDELYEHADAILNVCGSHELHDDLRRSEHLILVESDPGATQIRVDNGDAAFVADLARYQFRFTFGENIGTKHFPVPLHGLEWLPTRQPVVTDLWATSDFPSADAPFTTITNWTASTSIDWRGRTYLWRKSQEFLKFVDAPGATAQPFEIATDVTDADERALLRQKGWRLVPPDTLNHDVDTYATYVRASKGEFTATKEIVVALETAWFSDRSACYLAAGRPVITQETGFSRLYGEGAGLFGFRTMEDVVESVARVNADYRAHSRAARDIAREFFEAEKVLGDLLERAGV